MTAPMEAPGQEHPAPSGNVERLLTDQVRADGVREELRPLLEQVCRVMNDAKRHGLNVGWSIGLDQYGRHIVQNIDVTKPL